MSELEKLQAKNDALQVDSQLTKDIDKVLGGGSPLRKSTAKPLEVSNDEDSSSFTEIYGADLVTPVGKKKPASPSTLNPMNPNVQVPVSKAPETADRYAKAKVKLLTNQMEELTELKKKMEEQNRELTRQLKTERTENKSLNKRIQTLESELRRGGGGGGSASKRRTASMDSASGEDLTQEVAMLKKDLETAERIGKQADASMKTKDTQLKRAAETITRLKTQVEELQLQLQTGVSGDKAKIEELEARVKILDKQRAELLDGFRKQMKLIDILKRQKVRKYLFFSININLIFKIHLYRH